MSFPLTPLLFYASAEQKSIDCAWKQLYGWLMQLINLSIDIVELDAHATCKAHYENTPADQLPHADVIAAELKKAEDRTFYRCRIELNGEKMQMETPLGKHYQRQQLMMDTIEKMWLAVSAKAFPQKEIGLIIAG